jgi:hypothetical protein
VYENKDFIICKLWKCINLKRNLTIR